jgi:hypothetical protein
MGCVLDQRNGCWAKGVESWACHDTVPMNSVRGLEKSWIGYCSREQYPYRLGGGLVLFWALFCWVN